MMPAIFTYSLFLGHPSWEASAGVREEERWVRPHCVGSRGDSSLLQESGMLFRMVWDLELMVLYSVAPGDGGERQPRQLE